MRRGALVPIDPHDDRPARMAGRGALMMIVLTDEQRRELTKGKGGPLRVLDPTSRQEYVLVRAEVYDRLASAFAEEDCFAAEVHRQVMEVFGREGWDDLAMDVYDDLDPRRQP